MKYLNINNFFTLKTDYKNIIIGSTLLLALMLLLFVIEIFVFWGIFGEGASAGRISELWYVEIILDYLPILMIDGYLISKAVANYRNQKYIEFKTNTITVLILILLFLIRDEINAFIF